MSRLFLVLCVLVSACGGSQGPTPTTPTPGTLQLPAGAPSDAAAPAGTTRITITAIEIIGPDGARVKPDSLKVTPIFVTYTMRVWIFCPPGLEGPQGSGWNAERLEYSIRKSDASTSTGGSFSGSVRLEPGYTVLENSLSRITRAGQERVTTEILRNFAVIARNEFVATFSE